MNSLKMSQKLIKICSSSPILEYQFNLTQSIHGIMKSRSICTTKVNGGILQSGEITRKFTQNVILLVV